MRKRHKPYYDCLAELGFEVDRVEVTGSSHFKVYVRAGGAERWLLLPTSPSDRRAFMNFKSQARHAYNEMTGEKK